jgi:hypothetical protein
VKEYITGSETNLVLFFPSGEKTSAKKFKQVVPHLIICNKQRTATNCCIQPIPGAQKEINDLQWWKLERVENNFGLLNKLFNWGHLSPLSNEIYKIL